MTTTQKPTPDAVEALSDSLIDIDMCDLDGADYGTNALLAALKEKGFTIARAEPKPVKAEAPMPESVEKAIENITQKAFAACGTTQDARPFKKDRETIRAYIAVQQAVIEQDTQQIELMAANAESSDARLAELEAEVERLREG